MKGIDIIIKQAFDEAVVKNLEGIKKLLLGEIRGETKTIKTPKEDTEKQGTVKEEFFFCYPFLFVVGNSYQDSYSFVILDSSS